MPFSVFSASPRLIGSVGSRGAARGEPWTENFNAKTQRTRRRAEKSICAFLCALCVSSVNSVSRFSYFYSSIHNARTGEAHAPLIFSGNAVSLPRGFWIWCKLTTGASSRISCLKNLGKKFCGSLGLS